MADIPVLIAGGGPVGMTLALELARHGVASIVAERHHDTTRHPKMDLTNGRSMELYRRLGVADALQAAGVPRANRFDVQWVTGVKGHLLHSFAYPSAAERKEQMEALNDGTGTAEAGIRMSQVVLEPILRQACVDHPLIDVRAGWQFVELDQTGGAVRATLQNSGTGAKEVLESLYLVGCDGGRSVVREALAIDYIGQAAVTRLYMIHFKSSARTLLQPWGIAWHLQTARGTLIAQDDKDTWTFHVPLLPGTDEDALDPADILDQWVGQPFDHEILLANPWSPHMVIAESYRDDRVFLAGDAAHQIIPTGGYGMNSGVGDAVDLGWKLAGVLNGWGGEGLLESYEIERRPVAVRNQETSQMHWDVRVKVAELFIQAEATGHLHTESVEGHDTRTALGTAIAELGNAENECWGIEHGYRYEGSPIIAGEAEPLPAFTPLTCTPTTRPGARLPHLRLRDGTTLQQKLGTEFTLLVIGDTGSAGFAAAAADIGLPLDMVALPDEPLLRLLERRLILVRPDQHVAWRGDSAPDDAASILRLAAGLREGGPRRSVHGAREGAAA